MKPRVIVFSFLLISCAFLGVGVAVAADGPLKKVATTNYVDTRVVKTSGNVEIQNDAGKTVSVKNNPTEEGLNENSKTVTTVGWTDTNRTSKVKAIENNNTTLVDMWIE